MERRKAPRCGVDPSPAPGAAIDPVACAIRCPVRRHFAGCPQGAVFRVLRPAAVAIEVLDPRHLRRDEARRRGAFLVAIALGDPDAERVAQRVAEHVFGRLTVGDAELGALAAVQRHGAVGAFEDHLADPHRRLADAVVAVETVATGALGAKAPFDRGQVELPGRIALAQPHGHAAVVKLQPDALVVDGDEFELGTSVETDRGRADAHVGAGVRVGGEAVFARQRAVQVGSDPFAGVRAVEPDLAFHGRQPSDSPRRICDGQSDTAEGEQREQAARKES